MIKKSPGRLRDRRRRRGEGSAAPHRAAVAPPVPAAFAHARRPVAADRLRDRRRGQRRARADEGLALQRQGAGLAVRPQPAGADLSRVDDHAAVPVQRLLRRGRDPAGRCGQLPARGHRPGGRQARLDAGRTAGAAADRPGHAPYLRRGLERHRQMGRRDLLELPRAHRRGHRAPSTSASSAPTTTTPASTCRPRCTRRRC